MSLKKNVTVPVGSSAAGSMLASLRRSVVAAVRARDATAPVPDATNDFGTTITPFRGYSLERIAP